MNRTVKRFALPAVLVVVVLLTITLGSASAEIRLGILPRLSPVDLYVMFNPLAEYLTRETGEKVSLVIPKDFAGFKNMERSGLIDLGFANSLIYVQIKKDQNIEPLALSSEQKAGTKFRGIIIARKDSNINTVQDLKGKKLIFVEKDSAAGYIFQMLLLKKAGLDIQKDFTLLPFGKKHDNVTMAVFNKSADAGGIREDDLEKIKDKVDLSQIKTVAYSDYFPNWPMFAAPKLDKKAAARIRAALLKLKPGTPEARKVLEAAGLTGFVSVSDKDYDGLRQAAGLVGAL